MNRYIIRACRRFGAIGRMNAGEAALALVVFIASGLIAYVPLLVKLDALSGAVRLFGFEVSGRFVVNALVGAFVVHFGVSWYQRLKPQWGRFKHTRDRKIATSLALAELTNVCCGEEVSPGGEGYAKIRRDILETMVAHVEHQLRDREPGRITAAFLWYDETDHALTVMQRNAGYNGREGGRYRVSDLFCWTALEGTPRTVSVGDLRARMNVRRWGEKATKKKSYRDILAVPVLNMDGHPPHLGVVTFQAEARFVFDNREETVAVGLGPYVNLLRMSVLLELKEAERTGGQRHASA